MMRNAAVTVLTLGLLAGLTSCSSSSSGSRNAANPCKAIGGQPVGAEIHAGSKSRLAKPPGVCASRAEISNSGGCYPGASVEPVSLWFFYTTGGYTAIGKPGGKWLVHKGDFHEDADLKAIDC